MIMVALQMKNINYMYMTPWLVLHAAINLQAKQLRTISATNLARFPQCEAVEAHSLLPFVSKKASRETQKRHYYLQSLFRKIHTSSFQYSLLAREEIKCICKKLSNL